MAVNTAPDRGRSATAACVTLAGIALLGLATACGPSDPAMSPEEQQLRTEGRALYARLACGGCHGADRSGGRGAPPLTGLAAHWDEDTLADYLHNPGRVKAGSTRLQLLAEGYAIHMPPLRATDPQEVSTLVRFLLLE